VSSAVEEVRALGGSGAQRFLADVETRLNGAVAYASGRVTVASSQTLGAGGKRLRPLLVYLCASLDATPGEKLVRAAAAVELVHMATLVHDDVLDAAPLRRGRRTVWAVHGPDLAVAAGDYLYARAFAELAATGDPVAVQLLADAALDLARGEALQVEQTRRPETAIEDYLQRCRLKTGRLFVAACGLGARLGGLDETDQAHLQTFGLLLGLAFQLADDALDCDGDPAVTGKVLGTDVLDGTMTLPLLLAAARDPEVERTMREGVDGQGALPTLARVVATGAVRETRARAVEFAEEAERELSRASSACDAQALRVVLRRAVERDA
jgi:geranylgeranyl pyrophosphate synthase